MKKDWKRIWSIVVCAALILTLLPPLTARATDGYADYLDENGAIRDVTATEIDSSTTTLTDGWYVVDSDVTLSSSLTVNGDVKLILGDGKTLAITVPANSYTAGVSVLSGNSLTIYGQVQGTGTLDAEGDSSGGAAGIGGSYDWNSMSPRNPGTIIINGGIVIAKCEGANGTGIGGGYGCSGGDVTINGGSVTATGDYLNGGRGIGPGGGGAGGSVTINGGIVKAVGLPDYSCPGLIGGSVTINGGSLQTDGFTAPPTNSAGAPVYLNTLTVPGQANQAVTAGSVGGVACASAPNAPNAAGGVYGINGVTTDDGGKLYFYLPISPASEIVSATAGGTEYKAAYRRTGNTAHNTRTLSSDTAAPAVSGVSPSGSGAAISGSVTVTFSEAMDTDSGAVTLSGGSSTMTDGGWSNSATYTIHYLVSGGTTYTVNLSGFRDAAGNGLPSAGPYTFTTLASGDTTPPTVVSVAPAETDTDVPAGGSIAVAFSEPMDTSVGAVSLDSGATRLTGGTWSVGNTVYTVPYAVLYNKSYTVTLTGFSDTSGNVMGADSSHGFATAGVAYAGADGSSQAVPAGTAVTPVTVSAVTLTSGWYIVDSNVNLSASLNVSGDVRLILKDGKNLVVNASEFQSPAVRVAVGNSLTIYGQTGGTGGLSATSPYGAGIGGNGSDPSAGSITINGGVINAISEFFCAGIGGDQGRDGGTVTINGGSVTAIGQSKGAGIGGGGHGGGGGTVVINGGVVTATGGGSGGAGIGCSYNGSGGTVTINGGSVKASSMTGTPTNSAGTPVYLNTLTVQRAANEAVTAGSVGGIACAATPDAAAGVYGIRNVSTDSNGTLYFYLPVSTASEIVGATAGGAVHKAAYRRTSDTAHNTRTLSSDIAAPAVESVSPANSATNVPVSGTIAIAFVKTMDTDSGTVTLSGGSSTMTNGGWANGMTYTIHYLVSGGTTYTVNLSGFRDAAGNDLSSADAYTFTTLVSSDTTPPTVVSVSPTETDTDVPAGGSITVAFDEPMDTTVGTVSLDGGTTSLTGGTWSDSAAGEGAVYTVPYAVSYNKSYTVTLTGFTDTSGNALDAGSGHGFTTAGMAYAGADGSSQAVPAGTAVTPVTASAVTLTSGWYIVDSDVSLSASLKVNGDVRLILEDGKTLTVTPQWAADSYAAVSVLSGDSLTIYGQTSGTGRLYAHGRGFSAGIGGSNFNFTPRDPGTITINGGVVAATAEGYNYAAGIGGGYMCSGGAVTINGGSVSAQGDYFIAAPAIGPGIAGTGGSVTINGGIIKALGDSPNSHPAIIGGDVTINGGSLQTDSITGTPQNSANQNVYLNTLTVPGQANQAVTAGSINGVACAAIPDAANGVYGIRSVSTDGGGKLYFYLPVSTDSEIVSAAVDGATYAASYQRTTDAANNIRTMVGGSISLDKSGTQTFYGKTVGYSPVTALNVTVNSTGNQATGDLTVALSGTNAGSFTLSETAIGSIEVSGSGSFTVGPKDSLTVGTYTATVTVSGSNVISQSFVVSFTVSAAPTYTASIDPISKTFTAATAGYGEQTAQQFTITNTGTGTITGLVAALGGSNFEISAALSVNTLTSGQTATVSVRPKTELSANTYTDTLTITGDNSVSLTVNLSFTINAAPTYTASIDPTSKTFTAATAGYGEQTAQQFTVTNTGTGTITGLAAVLGGSNFEISTALSVNTLTSGQTATISVRPNTGLSANTYTDTLTITGDNSVSLTVNLSFTVNAAPTYTASIDLTSKTFTAATAGYGEQTAQQFTVTNTGTGTITGLAAALSGSNFEIGTALSAVSIAPGGTATVSVRPNTGLSAGTYTDTLTITGSNSVSLTVNLSFTVTAAPTCTVTFNSNSVEYALKTVATGSSIGRVNWPSDPTRSSYIFGGWFTGENGSGTEFTFTTTVSASITVYAKWTYTGGGGSTVSAPTYTAEVSGGNGSNTKFTVKVDKGTASASVDIGSQANALPAGEDLTVAIPSIPGVSTYSVKIAVSTLSSAKGQGTLTIKNDMGSLTAPSDMLAGVAGGKAEITISRGDKTGLPENIRAAVGDRPLIRLTLSIDGRQIDWNNPDAPVTASIPYTPTIEELANPESIVIWYIDGSGNVVSIPNGRYDPVSGTVVFSTTHFSNFTVAYNPVSFDDVSAGAWYGKAVTFIAARGITTGAGNGTFGPETQLTRGQFLVMLLRAYGIEPDSNAAANFSDAGDTYYTGYLSAAKRLGISNGIGNNMFAPNNAITRQEMFTLLYNALKMLGKLPEGVTGKTLTDFTDAGSIASWAQMAMTALIKAGTVTGDSDKLNPASTTTRAEMAQVLYNLLGK